jgi:hypothetical protein
MDGIGLSDDETAGKMGYSIEARGESLLRERVPADRAKTS